MAQKIFGIGFDGHKADVTSPEAIEAVKAKYGVPIDMDAVDFLKIIREIDEGSDYSTENALNGVNLAFKKMDILRAVVEPMFITGADGSEVVRPFSYEKNTAVANGVRYALSEFAPNASGFVGIGNENDLVLSFHDSQREGGAVHGHLFGTDDAAVLKHYGLEVNFVEDIQIQAYYFMGKHLTQSAS